jgi:hypothetical protein
MHARYSILSTVQASLFDLLAEREIGRELNAMSQWLDEHRELIGLAAEDLRRGSVRKSDAKACRRSRSCARTSQPASPAKL